MLYSVPDTSWSVDSSFKCTYLIFFDLRMENVPFLRVSHYTHRLSHERTLPVGRRSMSDGVNSPGNLRLCF